ncbi:MAG: N-acetylmuramoyl-L-alanine amidase [Rhodothermales bacterium]
MTRVHRRSSVHTRKLFFLVGVLFWAGVAQAGPVVERISFAPRVDGLGYVVRIHTTERLHAYSEPRFLANNQLELVLFNTEISQTCQRDTPDGPVQAYSVQRNKGHLLLRFQLNTGVSLKAAAYRDRITNDMLLGLTYTGDVPDVMPAPTRTTVPPVVVMPSKGHGEPQLDSERARWKLDTVVIDAGHGGHDSGAIGAGGVREKDVVLAVARKLGGYLEELLGLNVVYTRNDDRFISLKKRGQLANEAGGKLFISIHANAARKGRAQGAETYFLGLHKTDAARHVMERENSVVRYESDPNAYDGLNEQALIEQTLTQSAYMRSSELLAGLVQQQFAERVHRENRGVKQAGFYVLWGASMPAVLVELGFVTNPDEAAFLKSKRGQDYLASAIFRAVRDFKTQYEKGLDLVVSE